MISILLTIFSVIVALAAYAESLRAQTSTPVTASSDNGGVSIDEFDAVVKAASLAPLRSEVLPRGQREIRIWIGGGIGYPQDFYRIIDRQGHISGSLFYYWPSFPPDTSQGERPGETFGDIVAYHLRGRCEKFRRVETTTVCVARFTKPPDWRTILRIAEAAGLWSLPDESTLPRDDIIALDGWGITVELRNDPSYRTYRYDNPDAHKWPEAKQASEIAAAIQSVNSLVSPSQAERIYRGLYRTGPSLSEFVACGSQEKWGLQGNLGSNTGWSSRPRADTTVTGVTSRYVEVRGSLTPGWLAKKWRSKYPRVLEVSQIESIKPWSTSACK